MRGGEPLVVEDVAPAHQRAEPDAVGADLDLLQAGQLPQIDQQRRLGDAKRHHRHQALAAGERLRLAVVRGEQRNGFVEGGRAGVFEGRKFHGICFGLRPRVWNDAQATIATPRTARQRAGHANAVWYGSMPQHASLENENGRGIEPVRLQLRPHRRALRRPRADRGLRRHGGGELARGVVPPRLQIPGVRRHRNLDEQLSAVGGAQRRALRRHPGLRVAAVPALQHLHPHRPRHQDAAGPQGQDHRPAGIPDDRERLGARHAGGGIRRQAARHQMAARRTGGAGPRGARQDHAAAGDRPAAGAGRPLDLRHAGEGRDRRPAQRAGAELLPARRAERRRGCFRTIRRSRRPTSRRPSCFRSCTPSASAARWSRNIRGWR